MVLLSASRASAFLEPSQFFAPAAVPHTATLGANAEGIYFTGAPRYSGLDCSSCHTDGPQKVTLRLDADDQDLFVSGYVPGQTYELAVRLGNELEGLEYATPTCTEIPSSGDTFTYQQCNNNNFALEIDAADVPLASSFCATAPLQGTCPPADSNADEVTVAPGGDAVLANDAHSMSMPYQRLANDVTGWHMWWTAPPAGTGPVTIYVAAVDGNGGSGTIVSDQDPYGDDTVRGVFNVKEAGGVAAEDARAGCEAVPGRASIGSLGLLLGALLALRRRRVSR